MRFSTTKSSSAGEPKTEVRGLRLRDRAFQKVFSSLFVYNILYEDSEVDERYLGVGEDSSVFAVSAAGCGVANHLSRHARTIDAVDINRHHLALAALKVTAARRVRSYSTFYELLGRGHMKKADKIVGRIVDDLPPWMQRYWKRNADVFDGHLYHHGLTARLMHTMRLLAGVDTDWVVDRIDETVEQRMAAVHETFRPVIYSKPVQALIKSPVQLVALGINYEQVSRILETEKKNSLVDFILLHLERLCATDVEKNWFIWWAVAGHFNHDNPLAVPPYLRKDHHERSINAPTDVRFHHDSIFKVLGEATRGTWSQYTLCDVPDWLPPPVQKQLFDEVIRTSRDGAVMLYRSVEQDSLVARHGLQKHLQLMEAESEEATRSDRSRQYQRVNFYRVVH